MNAEDVRQGQAKESAKVWLIVVLIVLVVVVGWFVSRLSTSIGSVKKSSERLEVSVDRVEQSVDRTEAAAQEIVAFVREIQAQPEQPNRTAEAVQTIIDVLCASSDPARQQACAELTKPGG